MPATGAANLRSKETSMKYMLILIGEEGGWEETSPEEMKEEMDRWSQYGQDLVDAGAHVSGDGLQESSTATTVRIGSTGERLVTDGPFAETKEQVGGFYVIECANQDEAVEWAKKVPLSSGAIEVRPVMDYTQYGVEDPAAAQQTAS
jgi:hypothetical protein